jgi:putative endonuclease
VVILYVLKGKTGKRYVGITNNLSRRLCEHRKKATKGGQLINDFFVLYTEKFPDYKTAREREKFLKSGQGRKWLDKLESTTRPARVKQSLAGLCASGTFKSRTAHHFQTLLTFTPSDLHKKTTRF